MHPDPTWIVAAGGQTARYSFAEGLAAGRNAATTGSTISSCSGVDLNQGARRRKVSSGAVEWRAR
jgi:hypothetical protein